jgi:hypothetical protein
MTSEHGGKGCFPMNALFVEADSYRELQRFHPCSSVSIRGKNPFNCIVLAYALHRMEAVFARDLAIAGLPGNALIVRLLQH